MKKMKNKKKNNDDDQTKTTTMMKEASKIRNNKSQAANRTNNINSVMDIRKRSISWTRDQISNFSWFMEDQRRCQHSSNFSAPPSFLRPAPHSMPYFRHQSEQLSHVTYRGGILPYHLKFTSSGIPLSSHFPYFDPFFRMQPEWAEASSLYCCPSPFLFSPHFWVSPQSCPFMEFNGEMYCHSRTLAPRVVQPLVQTTRNEEVISRTKCNSNDCYASSSTMLYVAPPYDLDSQHDYSPIFHVPLKPETPMDKQQSLMFQNFPPPPSIRYKLTPPNSLFVPEENSLGNLFKVLQDDLVPKRPKHFLEDIKSEPDTTSSISPVHHQEECSEIIFLDHPYHIVPQEETKKYSPQTQEYDSSSSTEQNSDECFIDVETIEN